MTTPNSHSSKKPWEGLPPVGPLLRPKDAAAYLGYSLGHFHALVAKGELPQPIRMGRGQTAATAIPRHFLDAVIADRAAAR